MNAELENNENEIYFELYPKGPKGEDGFSPIIRAIETTDGYDIEITDINGTRTITVLNGMNGKDGQDGQDGQDAKINGYNSIELVAGENIRITQVGNQIIISATGAVPPTPTSDIQYMTSDNRIFLTSDNKKFILKESEY